MAGPKWYVQEEVAPNQWERLFEVPSVDQGARAAGQLAKQNDANFKVEGPVWPCPLVPYKPPMRGVPQPRDLSKVTQ
jgi:hypothetical protein